MWVALGKMSRIWVRPTLSWQSEPLYLAIRPGQLNLHFHSRCTCRGIQLCQAYNYNTITRCQGLDKGLDKRFKLCNKRFVTILSPTLKQNQMECKKFRKDAMDIFSSAVKSVYPPRMIRNAISIANDGNSFSVEDREYRLDHNVYVVGFGKAVSGMARTLEDMLGQHLIKGIISIPHGSQEMFKALGKEELCVRDTSNIQVFEGAKNNLPDENANMAAMAIEKLATSLRQTDILIVLISGGGSALLPSPVAPITLQESQEMTRVPSLGGATIQQLNVLRQNLETLKGGGLARVASPATVISLILSDVVGDKLDLISSGPTVPLMSSPRQCLQILESLNLMDKVPSSIVSLLQQRATDTKTFQGSSAQHHQMKSASSSWDHVQNAIIGSNSVATETALKKAMELDYVSLVLTNSLQGDCHTAAALFMEMVKFVIYGYGDIRPDQGRPELMLAEIELTKLGLSKSDLKKIVEIMTQAYNSRKGLCIICGGETTVDVRGSGKGGRNQEMALVFAMLYNDWLMNDKTRNLERFHVEFLSAGTDGQDGPTDAAGAVVNKHTVPIAVTSKLKVRDFLTNNDSYNFFKSLENSDNHIMSGLTGTNVMDIQLLMIKCLE